MAKRLDPKEELMVLICIKELKEATLEEIQTYLQEKHNLELSKSRLTRYISRWQKGKQIAGNMVGNVWAFSIRDIPWWPEAQFINILRPEISSEEAKLFLQNYKKELKDREPIIGPEPDIRDYLSFRVVMESIDDIAGGLIDPTDGKMLLFPRRGKDLVIPMSWLKGYFRDNIRLLNGLKSHILNYFAFSVGVFETQPTVECKTVIGMKGPQTHEVIPPGSKFTFDVGFPTHGSVFKSKDDLEKFLKITSRIPIKGFGAYSKAFGGRAKAIEITEVPLE